MGVRLALGARHQGVVKLVARKGLRLVLAGLGAGVLAALAAQRLLSFFLFGVSAFDPIAYVAAATVVAVFGLLACWLPARRASEVDPLALLRQQ
jgi:putative ABC transport system permease protein